MGASINTTETTATMVCPKCGCDTFTEVMTACVTELCGVKFTRLDEGSIDGDPGENETRIDDNLGELFAAI